MHRRQFFEASAGGLALAAVGIGRIALPADLGPQLLLVQGGKNTTHHFASNAQYWLDSLNAGSFGPALKPLAVTRWERHEDLQGLADLAKPGPRPYDAVVIYAWWGTKHGGSINSAEREGLRRFVADGGGLVVVHIGNGCFDDWPEYRRIVGGIWLDGQSTHTPVKPFQVHVINRQHPITRSLADFEVTDELYQRLEMTPEGTTEVLAVAREGGNEEPMAWTNRYGKGRVFYCALGHGPEAWGNPHVQRLLANGLQWTLP